MACSKTLNKCWSNNLFLFDGSKPEDQETGQAPKFTTDFVPIPEIAEGDIAHFDANLIPTGDQTMVIEWFYNGEVLKASHRIRTIYAFGMVALEVIGTKIEDSGTYTCRATNKYGSVEQSVTLGCVDRISGQKPRFTSHIQNLSGLKDGQSAHFEETQHEGALHRLSHLEDSSKYKRTSIIEEVVTQPPVFTMPVRDVRVAENQAVHFEARLIPVGDPKLSVEWLRNGVPIEASNRISTMHDFGYVALNMKYVNPEDSGTYTCRAMNELGQAVTSATLIVQTKASLQMETQNEMALQKIHQLEDHTKYQRTEEDEYEVTQPPRFVARLNGPASRHEGQSAHYECRIEPYPDPNMQVEWFHNGKPLQTGHRFRTTYDFGFAALNILTVYAEDSGEYTCKVTNRLGTASSSIKLQVQSKPQFGRPLRNVDVPEGRPVHLEATLTPVNDPTMQVEWFCNGKPILTGHRFKTTYDFGFVALDILYAHAEDSGTYMCKAKNAVGEAVTTSAVNVTANARIYHETLDAQRLEKIQSMQQIQQLEDYSRYQRQESSEEIFNQKPNFIRPLRDLGSFEEGKNVHFEAQLTPVNDPSMRVEWYKDGRPITASSRITAIFNFGYVSLNIMHLRAEDAGSYTVRAVNKMGEAISTSNIQVVSKSQVTGDLGIPEQQRYIEKVEQLEHYQKAQHQKYTQEIPESRQAPEFKTQIQNQIDLREGGYAHFEARLEPIGDSTLRVEWLKDANARIYHETLDAQRLEKIRQLESYEAPKKIEVEDKGQKPVFLTPLTSLEHLKEGEHAHLECRVEPINDPKLKIEWFFNGKAIMAGHRFRTTHDFGYVALDVLYVYGEDSGTYMCKATNLLGEAVNTCSIRVLNRRSMILDSQHPDALEKIQKLESRVVSTRSEVEDLPISPPSFSVQLRGTTEIYEGESAHFEAQVQPVHDPNLRIEFYRNGKPLPSASRYHITFDFGYIALDIQKAVAEDSGEYSVKAFNALGQCVSSTNLRVLTRGTIIADTQHPEGLEKIRQ
uniref:Ig-like domain-containing protein n=1 Tax=Megaselia scalaris TaxID=36166 RepID=T1GPM1_MEGSC